MSGILDPDPGTVQNMVGSESVCQNMVGSESVCQNMVESESVCKNMVGSESVCQNMVGSESVCQNLVGSESVCQNMVGSKSVCQTWSDLDLNMYVLLLSLHMSVQRQFRLERQISNLSLVFRLKSDPVLFKNRILIRFASLLQVF